MALIETVAAADVSLLTVGAGQHVILMDRAIRDRITRTVGAEAAKLFAQARYDGAGGPIDWYAPPGTKPGPLRPLASVDEPTRQRAMADVERLLSAVRAQAAELAASGDPAQRRMGDALAKAAQYPGAESIFLVGDQPVITRWGTKNASMARGTGDLVKDASPPPPAPPRPMPASSAETSPGASATAAPSAMGRPVAVETGDVVYLGQPSAWASILAALLLLFFIGAIARTLVPACGLNLFPLPAAWLDAWCSTTVASTDALAAETAQLERQLAELRRSITAPPCDVAAPKAEPAIERRVREEGGKVGEINVVLRWQTTDDLDLSVMCPQGQKIYHGSRSACGGELDVDRNVGVKVHDPIENIVFQQGQAAKGVYRIAVTKYNPVAGGPVAFEVIVRNRGREQIIPGTVDNTEGAKIVGSFEVD